MEITLLSQNVADALMKTLTGRYRSNFYNAFHAERDKPQSEVWALPEDQRLYYQAASYLFGINPKPALSIDLASFARVIETHPEMSCAETLKLLVLAKLTTLCRAKGTNRIGAALTDEGRKVFEALQAILPGVSIEDGYPYSFGRIDLE